ncbi:ABC transporter permease [Neobacillus ginsengisoli]|uniref:ABC-2 type transport system permease protein n=1 Tax=Neobacillus ginsengisoli TaxID=904295 RepID=A0ABT9XU82_9BACI|nr:ABC transporter permease [Neobacillus ginsengisoli]MDQ0198943.1 ABC-2 type transport system permease protein [Neobacillus ginsengisoli]
MKDIFWLMKKILSVTFRKKRNIIMYFGMPLVGIFISFLVYGGSGQQTLKVGIINEDHQQIANDTVQFLESLKNVQVMKINESEVNDKITSGTLDCAITLHQGFSESIINGNPGNIRIVSIKGAQITTFVKSYLYNYLDNIVSISKAANGDSTTFMKMYTGYQQANFKLTAKSLADTSKNKDMTYQTIGFLIMIMLMSSGNFAEIIIKEKENRTFFRLLSTPINARKYVLANIAVNMIVMLAQILFTIFMMTNIFHIEMHVPFWQMAIVLFMFSLVAVGLSLMIVSFASSSSSAGALQNLVSTPSCLLAGCFWPVEIMPEAVQKIADFMPQHWTLDTITKLQQGSHLGSLYLNFMILIAFALAFFLIATYKFGRNNSVKNFV